MTKKDNDSLEAMIQLYSVHHNAEEEIENIMLSDGGEALEEKS